MSEECIKESVALLEEIISDYKEEYPEAIAIPIATLLEIIEYLSEDPDRVPF